MFNNNRNAPDRINRTWSKRAEIIAETRRLLLQAKEELSPEDFKMMIETKLPFGPVTARRIMSGYGFRKGPR